MILASGGAQSQGYGALQFSLLARARRLAAAGLEAFGPHMVKLRDRPGLPL
jgi:hypothetical protein